MAEPTLAAIMAKLVEIEAEQHNQRQREREQTALLRQLVEGQQFMATNLDTLTAALDQINTATTQEAQLLQADTAKLDAIQALVNTILSTAGVPQAVLDKATQIQTALADVVATTTAQAARLDQIAQTPTNPVPPPAPAPTPAA